MSNLDWSNIPADELAAFLDGPALPPPDGVTPNFVHPENRNGVVYFICIFAMVVSTILLAARFYAQLVVSKQRHLVDLMALVSYVFFLAIVVGTLQGLSSGPGLFVHQWNLRAKNFKRFLYTVFIGTNFYGAGMLLLKTAILWEWMRIFVPLKTRNGFYWSCLAMLIINAIFYIVCIILSCLACRPFARNWDKTLAGHCIDVTLINISSAAVNFVIDLTILLLPQKVLWGLQISKRKKVGVSALFAVGALACATAAARISSAVTWHKSSDTLYHFSFISTWGEIEFICGYLVFAAPALPRALSNGHGRTFFSSFRTWASTIAMRLRRSRQGSTTEGSGITDGARQPETYHQLDGQHREIGLYELEPGHDKKVEPVEIMTAEPGRRPEEPNSSLDNP